MLCFLHKLHLLPERIHTNILESIDLNTVISLSIIGTTALNLIGLYYMIYSADEVGNNIFVCESL
jgi:hypothetical protein